MEFKLKIKFQAHGEAEYEYLCGDVDEDGTKMIKTITSSEEPRSRALCRVLLMENTNEMCR